MKRIATPLFSSVIAMSLVSSAIQINAAEFENRWQLVADAYSSVDAILGGDGDTAGKLAQLDQELSELKAKCDTLNVHFERASCHEDVRRLMSISQFMADPDDANRNDSFPSHIPDFVRLRTH